MLRDLRGCEPSHTTAEHLSADCLNSGKERPGHDDRDVELRSLTLPTPLGGARKLSCPCISDVSGGSSTEDCRRGVVMTLSDLKIMLMVKS